MRKIITFTIMFVLLFTITINAVDFRSVEYGMNIEKVKEVESANLVEKYDNKLIYETNVLGFTGELIYYFGDNGLAEGKIIINDFDGGNVKEIYDDFEDAFEEKYGKTTYDDAKYYREPTPDEMLDFDYMIRNHISKEFANWDLDKQKIKTEIKGRDGKAKLTIKYMSKEFDKSKNNNSI